MTNYNNTVLYTGITNNIGARVKQHKEKVDPRSFTARYNINKLVFVEGFDNVHDAITREKQIKGGSRAKKIQLIESINPERRDLYEEVISF